MYDNATFVLQKYSAHAPAPEKEAAADLLTLLKSFAATTLSDGGHRDGEDEEART